MPAGRPTDYKPEYCDLVIELGKDGASTVDMSSTIGVVRQTMYNWAEVHPDFMDALTRARELSQVWWEKAGRDGMGADKFNSAVWAKMVGARFADYQDRSKVELTGANGGPVLTAVVNVNPVRANND